LCLCERNPGFPGSCELARSEKSGKTKMINPEYERGDEIRVYYDPENPRENAPRRWDFLGAIFMIGGAQLFLALAISLIKNGFNSKQSIN